MPDVIEKIKALQAALNVAPDGAIGPKTEAALIAAAKAGRVTVAPTPVTSTDLPWMTVARGYLGEREIKGAADNARIVDLFAKAGHAWVQDDETAWCAAFVGGVLAQAGLSGSGSLAARSYEGWGVALGSPIYGCIGVKKRAGGAAWQGHVGFVVGANESEIILLGGNQTDAVSIAAFPRRDFTAYRYPSGFDPAKAGPLPASVAGAKTAVTES